MVSCPPYKRDIQAPPAPVRPPNQYVDHASDYNDDHADYDNNDHADHDNDDHNHIPPQPQQSHHSLQEPALFS